MTCQLHRIDLFLLLMEFVLHPLVLNRFLNRLRHPLKVLDLYFILPLLLPLFV